jgi:hypothetical protein
VISFPLTIFTDFHIICHRNNEMLRIGAIPEVVSERRENKEEGHTVKLMETQS